jgi:surfactin synthase thioesterase subunit
MRNIFLFPYGGGSASSYRSYADSFPSNIGNVIPVEIPGRGRRSHEEYAKSIQECAALALQEIDTTGEEYIFHGHCMGALLAFEAIKLIEASGKQLPRFMVVSGRNAPNHVNDWLRRLPGMDDRSLFTELQELGAVPRRLSFAMAQHFLTVLRHDQTMFSNYDPGETSISVPILVLAGRDDTMTNAEALAEWADCTSKFASLEWLDGEHYFIFDQPDRVALQIEKFCKMVDFLAPLASQPALSSAVR